MTSGNKMPVKTTRNNEIPSTPTCQPMFHEEIHWCCDVNWYPASPVLNEASIHNPSAPVNTDVNNAINLVISGRRLELISVKIDPTAGTKIKAVKIGNGSEPDVPLANNDITAPLLEQRTTQVRRRRLSPQLPRNYAPLRSDPCVKSRQLPEQVCRHH